MERDLPPAACTTGTSPARWVGPALSILGLVACSACLTGFVWGVDYEFEVSAERRDGGVETRLQASNRGREVDLVAADDVASFSFRVDCGTIEVGMRNEGPGTLRVLLDEARFVDALGAELELHAAGAGNRGAPASTVEAGSEATIFLWPRPWLREHEGRPATWRSDSPVDGTLIAEHSRDEAMQKARPHIGQTVAIVLPVERDGSRHTYRFRFTVANIHLERMVWA